MENEQDAPKAEPSEFATWMIGKAPRALRNQFLSICKLQGKTGKEVLLSLAADYIKNNSK